MTRNVVIVTKKRLINPPRLLLTILSMLGLLYLVSYYNFISSSLTNNNNNQNQLSSSSSSSSSKNENTHIISNSNNRTITKHDISKNRSGSSDGDNIIISQYDKMTQKHHHNNNNNNNNNTLSKKESSSSQLSQNKTTTNYHELKTNVTNNKKNNKDNKKDDDDSVNNGSTKITTLQQQQQQQQHPISSKTIKKPSYDLQCHLNNNEPSRHNRLSPPPPPPPIPVILMSLGRSGTASTWQIMSRLTGKQNYAEEYTGSSTTQSRRFFNRIPPDDHGRWLIRYLCHLQHRAHFKSQIVGFRWKPFHISHPAAMDALTLVAASRNIKIVRLRRNLLDVLISRHKHDVSHGHVKVHAHCNKNDEKCLENHELMNHNMTLPTKRLVKKLTALTNDEDAVDDLLIELNVPHVTVSYERLYILPKAEEEWMRLFGFLGVGPSRNLTLGRVKEAMEHGATSRWFHNETLGNYEEVRGVLRGTRFEGLLH